MEQIHKIQNNGKRTYEDYIAYKEQCKKIGNVEVLPWLVWKSNGPEDLMRQQEEIFKIKKLQAEIYTDLLTVNQKDVQEKFKEDNIFVKELEKIITEEIIESFDFNIVAEKSSQYIFINNLYNPTSTNIVENDTISKIIKVYFDKEEDCISLTQRLLYWFLDKNLTKLPPLKEPIKEIINSPISKLKKLKDKSKVTKEKKSTESYKISYDILHSIADKDFISETGSKTPMIKLFSFFCALKKQYNSSHIHYTHRRKIENNFTSKGTFSKYCDLLVECGLARRHQLGIVLIKMSEANEKFTIRDLNKRIYWTNIEVPINSNLRDVIKEFTKKLFYNELNKTYHTAEGSYINNKRGRIKKAYKNQFREQHTHYQSSKIYLSNKVLGAKFNRSASFAKKVKSVVKDTYAFCTNYVSLGVQKFKNMKNKVGGDFVEPTFYIMNLYPVKNLGQRMLIVK